MVGIWICRDENGIVDTGCVAEYADPAWLRELRALGRTPELIFAEDVTLGKPLPVDVVVCK